MNKENLRVDKLVEANTVLLGYIRNQFGMAVQLRDKFLDFITFVSSIAVAFVGVVATFANVGLNMFFLSLAAILLVLSAVGGILFRYELFHQDFQAVGKTISEIKAHLGGVLSDDHQLEDAAIKYVDVGEQEVDFRITHSEWLVFPIVVAIIFAALAFVIPTLDENTHANDLAHFALIDKR